MISNGTLRLGPPFWGQRWKVLLIASAENRYLYRFPVPDNFTTAGNFTTLTFGGGAESGPQPTEFRIDALERNGNLPSFTGTV